MRWLSLAAALALLLGARAAAADPQTATGISVGGAAVGMSGEFWDHGEFHLGAHSDVLFLRDGPDDFGLGPYLDAGTLAFDQLQVGAGASVLFPVDDLLPLVASAGGLMRVDETGVEPGAAASLFWGARSYNYHSAYGFAVGLDLNLRQSFGASEETALVLAARIDVAIVALPVVLLISAARGPSEDAEEIEEE